MALYLHIITHDEEWELWRSNHAPFSSVVTSYILGTIFSKGCSMRTSLWENKPKCTVREGNVTKWANIKAEKQKNVKGTVSLDRKRQSKYTWYFSPPPPLPSPNTNTNTNITTTIWRSISTVIVVTNFDHRWLPHTTQTIWFGLLSSPKASSIT